MILLLISEADMRTLVRDSLASQGYFVEAKGDIGAVVDTLREYTPDLLIIRPYIDSMPGHQAIQYLRTKAPGLRVLMVGGLMDDPGLDYQIENIHVFPKPFPPEQLLHAVREVLNGEPVDGDEQPREAMPSADSA
jgi:DNA-binding response OmpR family regulator